jgi:hypothetical protein
LRRKSSEGCGVAADCGAAGARLREDMIERGGKTRLELAMERRA